MATLPISKYLPDVSSLAFGCMGLGGGWDNSPITDANVAHARAAVETALDCGINLFDHADIYTFGKAEQVFGKLLKQDPSLREKMYIQSKCGIRFADDLGVKRYDFSAEWVTEAVNNSLQRLEIEQLDVLLLHRPDPLAEFTELAQALNKLIDAGKVKHLGVSNMNAAQIQLLQSYLDRPIVMNQLEMSLAKTDFVNQAISLPYQINSVADGTIEHCMQQGIQLQSWGSLAQGRFAAQGLHSDDASVRQTAEYVHQLAAEYQVAPEAIVLGFLTRHPANIQPVIGTANPDRIRACAEVDKVRLTREQWYTLLEKSLGHDVP